MNIKPFTNPLPFEKSITLKKLEKISEQVLFQKNKQFFLKTHDYISHHIIRYLNPYLKEPIAEIAFFEKEDLRSPNLDFIYTVHFRQKTNEQEITKEQLSYCIKMKYDHEIETLISNFMLLEKLCDCYVEHYHFFHQTNIWIPISLSNF
jgi:hypothetical protein